MPNPIHFATSPLFGLSMSWRVAACAARVDKVWTQEFDDQDVTCGNCLRTKAYKAHCQGEPFTGPNPRSLVKWRVTRLSPRVLDDAGSSNGQWMEKRYPGLESNAVLRRARKGGSYLATLDGMDDVVTWVHRVPGGVYKWVGAFKVELIA